MAVRITKGGLQSYDPNPFYSLKKKKEEEKKTSSKKELPEKETGVFDEKININHQPKIIRNEETGRIAGLEIGGRTYLGLSEKDINAIIEKQAPQQTPEGAIEMKDFLKNIDLKKYKPEDVEILKQQIAEEEAKLAPSPIQEQAQYLEERDKWKKKWSTLSRGLAPYITDNLALKLNRMSKEEMDLALSQQAPQQIYNSGLGQKLLGRFETLAGNLGNDLIGVSVEGLLDTIQNRKEVSEITATMSEMSSLLPAIEGVVNNQGITPQKALAELNRAQRDIEIIDEQIKRAATLKPEIIQSGEYQAMIEELRVYAADLRDARGTALEKLRTLEPQFNVLETQAYLAELEEASERLGREIIE